MEGDRSRKAEQLRTELEALRTVVRAAPETPGEGPYRMIRGLRIIGAEALLQLKKCVEALEAVLGPESDVVSLRDIEHSIAIGLQPRLERIVDDETVDAIRASLEEESVEDWTVTRLLQGATMTQPQIIQLGPIRCWQWPANMEEMQRLVGGPLYVGEGANAFHLENGMTLATISGIRARSSGRAEDLGDEQFHDLDDLLSYVLRWSDDCYDLGVFAFRKRAVVRRTAHSPTRTSTGTQSIGPILPIALDEPVITSPKQGNLQLWTIFANANRTPMQRRLLQAAQWIGKARRDSDRSKGFVQLLFALESMLQVQEKKVMLSPSIGYRLQETCAFLLGSNRKERLEIVDIVKDAYNLRSKIVHGGRAVVDDHDYRKTLKLVSFVLSKLLVDPELSQMSSPEDLSRWINETKYR